MRQPLKLPIPPFDLPIVQTAKPVKAESLDVHGRHDAAEDDRLTHARLGKVHGVRQVAHESPREGVTGARGVEHGFQGKRRSAENAAAAEHERAVAPLLDDNRLRPHGLHLLRPSPGSPRPQAA